MHLVQTHDLQTVRGVPDVVPEQNVLPPSRRHEGAQRPVLIKPVPRPAEGRVRTNDAEPEAIVRQEEGVEFFGRHAEDKTG